LVRTWGFLDGPKHVPSDAELSAALAVSGSGRVRFNDAARTVRFDCSGVEFNLGGIGKGFAIDRALGLLRARFHIRCAFMQGGRSSIRSIGSPPGEPRGWKVDIGLPLRPRCHLARVFLPNRALGTSSAANRFFVSEGRRYGHVLDPRSGRPAEGLLSASAVAATAAEADALSTAFFVMGVGQTRRYCREHSGVGALLVAPGTSQNAAPRVILTGAIDAEVFA
jgi:FAD:protein FMN transferase